MGPKQDVGVGHSTNDFSFATPFKSLETDGLNMRPLPNERQHHCNVLGMHGIEEREVFLTMAQSGVSCRKKGILECTKRQYARDGNLRVSGSCESFVQRMDGTGRASMRDVQKRPGNCFCL